jgi:hypothetical protein
VAAIATLLEKTILWRLEKTLPLFMPVQTAAFFPLVAVDFGLPLFLDTRHAL